MDVVKADAVKEGAVKADAVPTVADITTEAAATLKNKKYVACPGVRVRDPAGLL